ncbi:MAG: hypothetical protein ACP5QI_08165 [Candidatus Bathyarchaeia archaeon]
MTYGPGMAFLSISSPPWTPTLDEHTIQWEVDPGGWCGDPNRENNAMERSFTVSEPPTMLPGWEPPAGGRVDL